MPLNQRLRNIQKEILSDAWYKLYRYTFDYLRSDGSWDRQQREAYDRGNGAAVLLYNPQAETILLTSQFRMPTYINGNPTGFLTEACAGVLDQAEPEICIQREILEETGYSVAGVEQVMEVYTSPGAVTERMFLFVARYNAAMKQNEGGGLAAESEDIELLEWTYKEALQAMENNQIRDAKTLLLLQYAALYGPLKATFEKF
ncbi:NUDIX domain-containing protein [Robiginitalea sp. IMCC44478]|uniref:NUDIX domain-containing protein n=1 Tax=Robiginitalea sp. IMCC44478 TaxID=3459122 RepID=UPI004040F936